MLSFLKSPYPSNYGQAKNIWIGIYVGLFVSIFLYTFKPFGVSNIDSPIWQYLGYGLITFLGVTLVQFLGPRIAPGYFEERSYTIGKEILLSAILILTIGTGNAVYNYTLTAESTFISLIVMIFNTFLIGIFPLTFISLLEYNKLLKRNIKVSEEIKIPEPSILKSAEEQTFKLFSEEKETTFKGQELLYVESVGNYANIVQYKEDELSRTLHRTTLKALEEHNNLPNIVRCHRSYIVNLDQVQEVKGNAQGLKLHLKDSSDIIPVSRKYIPLIKSCFQSLS